MKLKSVKVLFVDEEPGNLDWMRAKLMRSTKGFYVYTSSKETEAMEIIERERPDICVIELYQMENKYFIDGIKILKKARECIPDAFCLMSTFFDTPFPVIAEAHKHDAYGILRRPEEIKVLMPILTKMAYLILERQKLGLAQTTDQIEHRLNNIEEFGRLLDEFLYQESMKRTLKDMLRGNFTLGGEDE